VQEPFFTGSGVFLKHGYTYSGHATACAAALENLRILDEEHLVGRVRELEPVLTRAVGRLRGHPLVDDVRVAGLAAAVEVSTAARADDPGLLDRLVTMAWDVGVLTRPIRGCALQISPPFVVTSEEIDAIVDGFAAALDAATT
jgi:adenosylmethionine-8-amino-7-oxononanoate aminotransferase